MGGAVGVPAPDLGFSFGGSATGGKVLSRVELAPLRFDFSISIDRLNVQSSD